MLMCPNMLQATQALEDKFLSPFPIDPIYEEGIPVPFISLYTREIEHASFATFFIAKLTDMPFETYGHKNGYLDKNDEYLFVLIDFKADVYATNWWGPSADDSVYNLSEIELVKYDKNSSVYKQPKILDSVDYLPKIEYLLFRNGVNGIGAIMNAEDFYKDFIKGDVLNWNVLQIMKLLEFPYTKYFHSVKTMSGVSRTDAYELDRRPENLFIKYGGPSYNTRSGNLMHLADNGDKTKELLNLAGYPTNLYEYLYPTCNKLTLISIYESVTNHDKGLSFQQCYFKNHINSWNDFLSEKGYVSIKDLEAKTYDFNYFGFLP